MTHSQRIGAFAALAAVAAVLASVVFLIDAPWWIEGGLFVVLLLLTAIGAYLIHQQPTAPAPAATPTTIVVQNSFFEGGKINSRATNAIVAKDSHVSTGDIDHDPTP